MTTVFIQYQHSYILWWMREFLVCLLFKLAGISVYLFFFSCLKRRRRTNRGITYSNWKN